MECYLNMLTECDMCLNMVSPDARPKQFLSELMQMSLLVSSSCCAS